MRSFHYCRKTTGTSRHAKIDSNGALRTVTNPWHPSWCLALISSCRTGVLITSLPLAGFLARQLAALHDSAVFGYTHTLRPCINAEEYSDSKGTRPILRYSRRAAARWTDRRPRGGWDMTSSGEAWHLCQESQ